MLFALGRRGRLPAPASSRLRLCRPRAPPASPRGSAGGAGGSQSPWAPGGAVVDPRPSWPAEVGGGRGSPADPASRQPRNLPAGSRPAPGASLRLLPASSSSSRALFFPPSLPVEDLDLVRVAKRAVPWGSRICIFSEFWLPLRACGSLQGTQDPALARPRWGPT